MNLKKSDYKPYPGFFDLRIFDLDSKQFFAAWRIQDYLYSTSKQKAYYQKYNPFAWEQIKELSARFQMFLIPRLKENEKL